MREASQVDEGGGEGSDGVRGCIPTVSEGVPEVDPQHQGISHPPPYLEDDDEGEDYETAITATGYGPFQYWLILIGGFANASDAIEILCVSILLPAAECDLHMSSADKGWLSAMAFIGMMIGGYVWGCLGDIYGRRNVLMVSLMVNALSGFGSSLVQTFPTFLFFRFVSGLGVGGSIPLVWAYISEFQPPHRRGAALSIIASFWMIGNILVAVFALVTIPYDIRLEAPGFVYNSWRVFLTICAFPALIIAILMLWLPESPMFLLMKDRKDETLDVLRKMYSRNTGRQPYTYPIKLLSTSGLKVQKDTTQNCWGSFSSTVLQTWHHTKAMFSRSLIFVSTVMLIINFTIQFGYYGLWLWFPELFNRLQQYGNEHPDEKFAARQRYDVGKRCYFWPSRAHLFVRVLLTVAWVSLSPRHHVHSMHSLIPARLFTLGYILRRFDAHIHNSLRNLMFFFLSSYEKKTFINTVQLSNIYTH